MVRTNHCLRSLLFPVLCFIILFAISTLNQNQLPIFENPRTENIYSKREYDQLDSFYHHPFNSRIVRTKTRYPEAVSAKYIFNNPSTCKNSEKVNLLILVYSKVTHWRVRKILRQSWLNATRYKPSNVVIIFLLGTVDDSDTQDILKNESAKYNDVVQGDFIDSYRNLTNKGVMGLRWITENCRNAEMVIKIDEDAYVNIFKLMRDFSHLKKRKIFIYCNKINNDSMPIERGRWNKWYVQEDYFRGYSSYPHAYCSGIFVFLSSDIIPSMYHAAMASPFFWVDDFYLFGILPSKIPGVQFEDIGSNFTYSYEKGIKCLEENGFGCQYLVMMAKFIRINLVWNAVLKTIS